MKEKHLYLIIGLIAVFSLFFKLGGTELRAEEPRRATVSIEMLESGNWQQPYLLDQPYINKPPLYNWILASWFKLSGNSSEFAVRTPGIISLILIAGLIFFFFKSSIGANLAALAALLFLSFGDLLFYASVNAGEIDLFFSLLVFVQVYFIFQYHQKGKTAWLYLSYLVFILAFMTKGLPAVLFQATASLAALMCFREFTLKHIVKHLGSLLISCAIICSYFYIIERNYGWGWCYLQNLFIEAGQRSAMGFDVLSTFKNALIFPFNFFKLLLPWSLLVLPIFSPAIRKEVTKNRLNAFIIWFVLLSIPFFMLTGEIRNRYLYPLFPFIAVLAVSVFNFCKLNGKHIKSLRKIFIFIGFVAAVIPIAAFVAFRLEDASILIYSFFTALLAMMVFLNIKLKPVIITPLIASLFILKIFFSWVIQPVINSRDLSYRDQMHEVMKYTGGSPLNFDIPGIESPSSSIECNLELAAEIPYQYSYYHYIESGEILKADMKRSFTFMRYTEEMEQFHIEGHFFKDKNNIEYVIAQDY